MTAFRPSLLLAFGLTLSAACTGGDTESGGASDHFCESFDDHDTWRVEDGGGTGSSGEVQAWLITDESDDLHDLNLVGFVDYTLDNLDTGGSQQTGSSDQDGYFYTVLGAGNWRYKHGAQKQGYDCNNEIDFEVEAGNTTLMCVDVNCL